MDTHSTHTVSEVVVVLEQDQQGLNAEVEEKNILGKLLNTLTAEEVNIIEVVGNEEVCGGNAEELVTMPSKKRVSFGNDVKVNDGSVNPKKSFFNLL